MCGRYTLRRPDLLRKMSYQSSFDEFSELKIPPRFNIAPSQDVVAIRSDKAGHPALTLIRWGLIPSWTKGKPKLQPINARAETIGTSRMFKTAFDRRRCLIPADGFYEWRKIDAKTKQPMYMHRRDNFPFAFAGLWERWRPDPDAEPVDTCTIITTTPNGLMAPIHDRMPVILADADCARWLNREIPGNEVADVLKPYTGDEFEAIPVATLVNSPRNDTCDCVAPLAE